MISKRYFPDNCSRIFIPYKGYCKVLKDGTEVKDEKFEEDSGPFKIIPDPLSHGNWHTLDNLLDNDGNKLLPKGIRSITYFNDGFYLLEDNNEDELLNKYKCIPLSEYRSCMNVMRKDGTLLSEEWFGEVRPCLRGIFHVCDERRCWYFIELSGEIFDYDLYHIGFGCIIKPNNNTYAVYDLLYNKISEDYSSVMWSSKGIWDVNLLFNGKLKTFFCGQGEEIISYAHEILIKHDIVALVEKGGVWYSFDTHGILEEQFYWNPSESSNQDIL